jgi:hypothetical protein
MVRSLLKKIVTPEHPKYPISKLSMFGCDFSKFSYLVQVTVELGVKQDEDSIWNADSLAEKNEIAIIQLLVT